MVQLAQYYCSFDKRGGCNEFWKTLLESFGLEKFADSSKPIGIPSNNIIENGNKDWMWNLRTSESMYFDNKTKVWFCGFKDVTGKVIDRPIDLLRTTLEPEDHFRVYAFIQLLNKIKEDRELLNE